ncbi:pathogenesis-related protein 1A-like [Diospyros lotus]|uniref:pathogenesis-related protein 1A-like n=1 Tax=Diospyros lotus TaxID=55363 RepID=UPI0022545493|nr:pathogenesis-related protein 1A-like [Diospyros lotus]
MALSKLQLFIIVSLTMAFAMGQLSLAQNSPIDFLAAHNVARASVGLKPMIWNRTVAAYAQKYASVRSADCNLEHSEGPYGENIAEGYGDLSATDAVKMWVDEKQYYDHDTNTCSVPDGGCLHYTQVVWRKSTDIGCARAHCKNGWWFVTCNYYPPGNYIGEVPY